MLEAAIARRHWPGTKGARDVRTDALTELALGVEAAIARFGLAAVDGPVGVGKSFAIKLLLERVSVRRWFLPIGPEPTGKTFEADMLQAIYDERFLSAKPRVLVDRTRLRSDMREEIRATFEEPGVFVIDDFTKSGLVGVEMIRWLLEQPTNQTGIILLGNQLAQLLRRDPALYSRIIRIVPFDPIPEDTLVEVLRRYHPLFETAKPELLLRVNRDHARGSFRDWANVLATALEVCDAHELEVLDDAVARQAVDLINKRRPRETTPEPERDR